MRPLASEGASTRLVDKGDQRSWWERRGKRPDPSRPPTPTPKLREPGQGGPEERNREQDEKKAACGQLAFVTQPCLQGRGREGVSWKKLGHGDKLAPGHSAADEEAWEAGAAEI